jgi:hypothetical protein
LCCKIFFFVFHDVSNCGLSNFKSFKFFPFFDPDDLQAIFQLENISWTFFLSCAINSDLQPTSLVYLAETNNSAERSLECISLGTTGNKNGSVRLKSSRVSPPRLLLPPLHSTVLHTHSVFVHSRHVLTIASMSAIDGNRRRHHPTSP